VDLDFFTGEPFDEAASTEHLIKIGKLEIVQRERQSAVGLLDGVKFSFLEYRYPILTASQSLEGTLIASVEDIACMKLEGTSGVSF